MAKARTIKLPKDATVNDITVESVMNALKSRSYARHDMVIDELGIPPDDVILAGQVQKVFDHLIHVGKIVAVDHGGVKVEMNEYGYRIR